MTIEELIEKIKKNLKDYDDNFCDCADCYGCCHACSWLINVDSIIDEYERSKANDNNV